MSDIIDPSDFVGNGFRPEPMHILSLPDLAYTVPGPPPTREEMTPLMWVERLHRILFEAEQTIKPYSEDGIEPYIEIPFDSIDMPFILKALNEVASDLREEEFRSALPANEGEPGTFSHCGNSKPHPAHTHSFAMNEGPYNDVPCSGTTQRQARRYLRQ